MSMKRPKLDDIEIVTSLKILMIGDSSVGKSSLLLRFIDDKFESNQSATIGVDYKVKFLELKTGGNVKLSIWDTAGQERFRTLTPSYYRGAQGAILVYDVSKPDSLIRIEKWLAELETFSTKTNIVKILVGNKIDVDERAISREDGLRLARRQHMLYTETSALTSEGVAGVFHDLVDKVLQDTGLWAPENDDVFLDGPGDGTRKKSSNANIRLSRSDSTICGSVCQKKASDCPCSIL